MCIIRNHLKSEHMNLILLEHLLCFSVPLSMTVVRLNTNMISTLINTKILQLSVSTRQSCWGFMNVCTNNIYDKFAQDFSSDLASPHSSSSPISHASNWKSTWLTRENLTLLHTYYKRQMCKQVICILFITDVIRRVLIKIKQCVPLFYEQ